MKAIIYARYSSDNQREESIEGQIRECMEFAERNSITVFGYIHRPRALRKDGQPPRIPADDQRQLSQTVRYRARLEVGQVRPQPLRLRLLQEYSQKERRKGHFGKGEHLRWTRRRVARIDA